VSLPSGERDRARMNAAVAKMAFEANRRDLEEITRGRYLDQLGVRGHVAFGFYVDGFGEAEAGSLCNAAVIPSSVLFLDADENAAPGAELGRAPREDLSLVAEEWRASVAAPGFEAPWRDRSVAEPGGVDVRGRVVVRWPAGQAAFAFATLEGAQESMAAVRSHIERVPEV
jgi:hypothetical protein